MAGYRTYTDPQTGKTYQVETGAVGNKTPVEVAPMGNAANGAPTQTNAPPAGGSMLQDDRDRALADYQRLLEAQNRPDFHAPEVMAQDVQSRDVIAPGMNPIERVLGQTVNAPAPVQVQDPGAVQQVTARDVTAATAAPVSYASTDHMQAARVNTAPGDQVREHQLGNVSALEAAARGEGPSAAQAQYQRAMEGIAANQFGMAAQARGTQRGALMRTAMQQGGVAGQRAALDTALVRATEQAAARGQLAGALTDVRGADTGVAVEQARLNQGAATTNVNASNVAHLTNAAADNARAEAEAARKTNVAVGNADRGLTADTTNAGAVNARGMDITKLKAGVDAGNADRGLTAATTTAQLQQGAQTTNAAANNARQDKVADMHMTAATGNANRDVAVATGNADRGLTAGTANQGAAVQSQGLNQTREANLNTQALAASGQAADVTKTKVGVDTAKRAQNMQLIGGILGGGAAVGAAAASDVRLKEDVRRESDHDVDRFIDALEAYSYRYKDPATDGAGQRHGVMAQDLEKSAIGRSVVRDTPHGKMVDTEALTLAMAGVVARKLKELRR